MTVIDTYIYGEIPIGTVDGVNKVFTTLYNVNILSEFFVGGVPYRGIFSIGTNTITLNEAPPIGAIVSVDYFKI